MRFRYCFYGLICLLGLFLLFQPTILSGFRLIPGDPGDGRLNNYFLEHTYQLVANRSYQGSLFSPLFFFPEAGTLAYSENLFGSAPLYWLFRAFTAPDNAFAFWMMAVSVLNFGATVYTLRRFQVQPVLASLGGFLMAFPMSRAIRLGHAQLLPQFCTPLAVLYFWQFLQQPSRLGLVLLLGFTYWQVLCSVYLGWFLLFGMSVMLLLTPIVMPTAIVRMFAFFKQHWRFGLVAFALWFGALLALFFPYLEVKKMFGPRPYGEVLSMLPRGASWLVVPQFGTLWSSLLRPFQTGLPMVHEHHIFLGMTLYGLTIWTLWILLRRSPWLKAEQQSLIKLFLYSGLVIFFLSLVLPGNFSAWWLVYTLVPGASGIRAVTRIFTLINIYWLIAGLVMLNQYLVSHKHLRRTARAIGLTALLSFAIFEQSTAVGAYDKLETRKPQQELVPILKAHCQLAYYEFPSIVRSVAPTGQPFFPDQSVLFPLTQVGHLPPQYLWITGQMMIMWVGILADVPVVNGYTGMIPKGFPNVEENWTVPKSIDWLGQKQFFQQGNFCHIQDILPTIASELSSPAPVAPFLPALKSYPSGLKYQTTIPSKHFLVHVFRKTA